MSEERRKRQPNRNEADILLGETKKAGTTQFGKKVAQGGYDQIQQKTHRLLNAELTCQTPQH